METLKWITSRYNYIFTDLVDSRSTGWLFTEPYDILGIVASYLCICVYVGPRYMKKKPAYKLQNVLIAYNAIQVILNAFIAHEGFYFLFIRDFDFTCQPSIYSTDKQALRLLATCWFALISKIMDLWDTIFFVLRKKTNQVTFLHVYHHCLMVIFTWIGLRFSPGGHSIVVGTLNSVVHVAMYTYYLMTSLGPEYTKYVWWKKYLTQLQLAQFVILAIYSAPILFRDCAYPRFLTGMLFTNSLVFIYLFGNFYVRSYQKSSRLDKSE